MSGELLSFSAKQIVSVAEDIANTNKSQQNCNNAREAIVFVRSKAQFIQCCHRNELQYVCVCVWGGGGVRACVCARVCVCVSDTLYV